MKLPLTRMTHIPSTIIKIIITYISNPSYTLHSNPLYTLHSNQLPFKYKPPPLKLWGAIIYFLLLTRSDNSYNSYKRSLSRAASLLEPFNAKLYIESLLNECYLEFCFLPSLFCILLPEACPLEAIWNHEERLDI